jgi:hypothetical protein
MPHADDDRVTSRFPGRKKRTQAAVSRPDYELRPTRDASQNAPRV